MVKKLEKGATVSCYKCHGEWHKFYKCPQFVKKMNNTIKSSLIYSKPNRKKRTRETPTSSRKV
jgi:hypothetical protein